MNRKRSQKVFKHVLCNPFFTAWPEISNEETHQITSILSRESLSQATSSIQTDLKKQKTSTTNLESFSHQNLILGINNILQNIDKVSIVLLFRCDANEVILEPLMLLCHTRQIKCLSGSFQVAYEKLREITGISKLAALALPTLHPYPLLEIYLKSLTPRPAKAFLPVLIKSTEIQKVKKIAK